MKRILFLIVFVFIVSNVFAGFIITEEIDGSKETIYIQKNKFKTFDESQITIFDLDKQEIYIADITEKVYYGGTIKDIQKSLIIAYDTIIKNIENTMEELSADEKQYFEGSLKSIKELKENLKGEKNKDNNISKVEILPTDESEKIAGFNAKKYNIIIDDILGSEIYITKEINIQKELDFKKLLKFQQEVSNTFDFGEDKFIEFVKLKKIYELGFPLKETLKANYLKEYKSKLQMFEMAGVELEEDMKFKLKEEAKHYAKDEIVTNVIKIEEKKISSSEFIIPKDYKKLEMDEILESLTNNLVF